MATEQPKKRGRPAKTLDELEDIPRADVGTKPKGPTEGKKVVEKVSQPEKGRQVATKQVRNRPVTTHTRDSRHDKPVIRGGLDWSKRYVAHYGAGSKKYYEQDGKKFDGSGAPLKE